MSVSSHNPDNQELTKKLVDAWFRNQATEVFNNRLAVCLKKFKKLDDVVPNSFESNTFVPNELNIKKLKTRWGFMTPLKEMTLNTKLIHAPLPCIDYVIIHELCHIKHNNHRAKFWQLLEVNNA